MMRAVFQSYSLQSDGHYSLPSAKWRERTSSGDVDGDVGATGVAKIEWKSSETTANI